MFSPEVADCVHQYWLVQQRKQIEAFLKNTADPDLSFQIILNQIDTELQHYTHEDEEDEFELTREELCQKYQEAFARQEKLNIERIDAEAKLAAQALVNRNTWGPGLSPVMKKSSSSEIRHTPLYEFRYRTT